MCQAEKLKAEYPPGTRIVALDMGEEPIDSGERGTVMSVHDDGKVFCHFDCGAGFGFIPGENSFRKLTDAELKLEEEAFETKQRAYTAYLEAKSNLAEATKRLAPIVTEAYGVLKDEKATEEQKEQAKERIAAAETEYKKITETAEGVIKEYNDNYSLAVLEDKRMGSEEDDVPHFFCGDCVHFNPRCTRRIDQKIVKFAVPWFKSYDSNQFSGIICSDFEPPKQTPLYAGYKWPGFDTYWKAYIRQWLPYRNTKILVYFTLNDDTSVRYGVNLMDFVNGTMYDGNKLKAVTKMYVKKRKPSKENSFSYTTVCEKIEGVELPAEAIQAVKKGKEEMKILVESKNVWREFEKLAASDERIIATNEQYGIEISLLSYEGGVEPRPMITVAYDGDIAMRAYPDKTWCEPMADYIYSEYLSDSVIDILADFSGTPTVLTVDDFASKGLWDEYDPIEDMETVIEDREDALNDMVYDFAVSVLEKTEIFNDDTSNPYYPLDNPGIINDLKDHFLEYMARKHGFKIYRPMMLTDEDGDFYEEFPYEHMEFEDANNPIYRKKEPKRGV